MSLASTNCTIAGLNALNLTRADLPFCPTEYVEPYPIPCQNRFDFQFSSIYAVTQNIFRADPNSSCLWNHGLPSVTNQTATLTLGACLLIAGTGYTLYPEADIWARLTIWKFPLLQLAAVFPRPPLGLWMEALVFFRLLGNPIGTLHDLILKITSCQARAVYWRTEFEQRELSQLVLASVPNPPDNDFASYERLWKAFTLIVDSYDEWGRTTGTEIRDVLRQMLAVAAKQPDDSEQKHEFLVTCLRTSDALAADRSTKFLPIAAAMGIYIGSVAIAFGRDSASASQTLQNQSLYLNIEAHSVAFTALYFWIIATAFLGSIIGSSQSEEAIKRILGRFERELGHLPKAPSSCDPIPTIPSSMEIARHADETRKTQGGAYSWQIHRWKELNKAENVVRSIKREMHFGATFGPVKSHQSVLGKAWRLIKLSLCALLRIAPGSYLFPLFLVTIGTFTGALISSLVPPLGWNCRHKGELTIWAIWMANACLDYFQTSSFKKSLAYHLTKDVAATFATFGLVGATQFGIYNRCECWANSYSPGIQMPEVESVAGLLTTRIRVTYPAIAFSCIAFQLLIVPMMFGVQYFPAMQVFVQRDDGSSNFAWLQRRRRSWSGYGSRQSDEVGEPLQSLAGGRDTP